jgi:hypothetical protein
LLLLIPLRSRTENFAAVREKILKFSSVAKISVFFQGGRTYTLVNAVSHASVWKYAEDE